VAIATLMSILERSGINPFLNLPIPMTDCFEVRDGGLRSDRCKAPLSQQYVVNCLFTMWTINF
jgi:hypothetical protein